MLRAPPAPVAAEAIRGREQGSAAALRSVRVLFCPLKSQSPLKRWSAIGKSPNGSWADQLMYVWRMAYLGPSSYVDGALANAVRPVMSLNEPETLLLTGCVVACVVV